MIHTCTCEPNWVVQFIHVRTYTASLELKDNVCKAYTVRFTGVPCWVAYEGRKTTCLKLTFTPLDPECTIHILYIIYVQTNQSACMYSMGLSFCHFVILEQFPMRHCSTYSSWGHCFVTYIKKLVIQEFVVKRVPLCSKYCTYACTLGYTEKCCKRWNLLDWIGLDCLFIQGKPLANGYYTRHPGKCTIDKN